GEREKGKGKRGKGKGERGKGKGKRGKGKGFKYMLYPYPLTFSQTTREVHTAYPNCIDSTALLS
ncbi:hypothetical protein, partial [Nostoc linckia]|uniref:hypothetical protein n=1 Tax=Nostoc linckia TaxID=92942 RepID=UPI0011816517